MSAEIDNQSTDAAALWRTSKPRTFWSDAVHSFAHNFTGMLGLLIFVLLLLAAIFANQIAPYDYLTQDWNNLLKPPNGAHLMGTDELGRDVFSRAVGTARLIRSNARVDR